MIGVYIGLAFALGVALCVWRVVHVRRVAKRLGVDFSELFLKDVFGRPGAVEREEAEMLLARSVEENKQLKRQQLLAERDRDRERDRERDRDRVEQQDSTERPVSSSAETVLPRPAQFSSHTDDERLG